MLKRHIYIAVICSLTVCSAIFIWLGIRYSYRKKTDAEYYIQLYDQSIQKYGSLKNKNINALDELLGEDNLPELLLVYLFSANDCGPCVDRGFDFIKTLQKNYREIPLFAISDNSGISAIQDRNDYTSYVFTDNEGLIRKELEFCLTPVLFLMVHNEIIEMYFPKNLFDINGKENFRKEIIRLTAAK